MVADPVNFLKGNGASYIRVASIAVATYDYILTLPAEWRFYKGQRSWRLSPGCSLFILIRYLSIATLTVSNVGFFGEFSAAVCKRYFIVAPVFKVLQTMVSQVILGIRTYNISKRSRWVMWLLTVLFILTTSMEWFTNLWDRTPAQISQDDRNCTPGNNSTHLSVWLYYVLAMFYDIVTLGISSCYLFSWQSGLTQMSSLIKLMVYDGLGYFVVLTGANILNLILYRTADESYQSSGASVGYTVTWIMSQRILIHLRDAAAEHQVRHVVTHQLQSGRDIARAMRTHLEGVSSHKGGIHDEDEYDTKGTHRRTPTGDGMDLVESGTDQGNPDIELDVQVQIEQTVTVDYDPHAFDRETYRKTRARRYWDDLP